MNKRIKWIIGIFLILSCISQFNFSQEPGEWDIHQLLLGTWRVEISRIPLQITIMEDLILTNGIEIGRLEILNEHNVLVLFMEQEKGFEIQFESEMVMMVRAHNEERWVRCERIIIESDEE
jgi:hypothetical protein